MNPLRAQYTVGTRIGTRVLVAGPESIRGRAHYLAACDCGRPATWVPAAQLRRGMRQCCRWCGQQARRQASQRDARRAVMCATVPPMTVQDVLAALTMPTACTACAAVITDENEAFVVPDEEEDAVRVLCRECVAKEPS